MLYEFAVVADKLLDMTIESSSSPVPLELPASAEELLAAGEAERVFDAVTHTISDAIERELAADPASDPRTVVTASINAGRIPPIIWDNGTVSRQAPMGYRVLSAAVTPATYQLPFDRDGLPSALHVWKSETGQDTGESRTMYIPFTRVPMKNMRTGIDISPRYAWGRGVGMFEDERAKPEDVIASRNAATAFALGTALGAWQEDPQPLPVITE